MTNKNIATAETPVADEHHIVEKSSEILTNIDEATQGNVTDTNYFDEIDRLNTEMDELADELAMQTEAAEALSIERDAMKAQLEAIRQVNQALLEQNGNLENAVSGIEEDLELKTAELNAVKEDYRRKYTVAGVQIKTLKQSITSQADEELGEMLSMGWEVLDLTVLTTTHGGADDIISEIVRVVTLKRENKVETSTPEDEARASVSPTPPAFMLDEIEGGTAVLTSDEIRDLWANDLEDDDDLDDEPWGWPANPEPAPVRYITNRDDQPITFAEALKRGGYSAEELAEIGNRQAIEAGKRAFVQGMQNRRVWDTPLNASGS